MGAGLSPDSMSSVDSDLILRLEGITKTYHMGDEVVHALNGIDLSVTTGEFLAIMGTSGSGKSTLLNMLGCLDRPTSGTYYLGDREVSRMPDDELSLVRGERIGFVFQSYNLVRQLTVLENIEVPMFYQGMNPVKARERSLQLAEKVGLGERTGHRPSELSGGQQQRVAIARSLANDPLMILADEPTGNLDSRTEEEVLTLLEELNREGKTILIVTHDDHVAERARRVIRLRDGQIASDSINPGWKAKS